MNKYVIENLSIEKLTNEIEQEDSLFFFAFSTHNLIGYLKINTNKTQTEQQIQPSLEIERIYVLQKYHGKKIGQILLDQALQLAQNLNVNYVWLGVWEKNPRAISFYKKNGFEVFDQHSFQLGDDLQTDIMMKKSI